MLKIREKRRAARASRALDHLNAIEAAVAALNDDDLLDFADIFETGAPTPLRDLAATQLRRRNLTL